MRCEALLAVARCGTRKTRLTLTAAVCEPYWDLGSVRPEAGPLFPIVIWRRHHEPAAQLYTPRARLVVNRGQMGSNNPLSAATGSGIPAAAHNTSQHLTGHFHQSPVPLTQSKIAIDTTEAPSAGRSQ